MKPTLEQQIGVLECVIAEAPAYWKVELKAALDTVRRAVALEAAVAEFLLADDSPSIDWGGWTKRQHERWNAARNALRSIHEQGKAE